MGSSNARIDGPQYAAFRVETRALFGHEIFNAAAQERPALRRVRIDGESCRVTWCRAAAKRAQWSESGGEILRRNVFSEGRACRFRNIFPSACR